MLPILRQLVAALLISVSVGAQQKAPTNGWDLSYESVRERNKVGKTELISLWFERYKSPASGWVAGWDGKPIISSILIEYPAFHAAELTTMWLVRTEDEAFYWDEIQNSKPRKNEEPIAPRIYDSIYRQVSSWQQMPKPPSKVKENQWPGYFGFLSYQDQNGSKQMLLTSNDFIGCRNKSCLPGKGTTMGRVMAALEPILVPESEKNYKHKSEAEIARMTPEQRIDEEILEHESHRSVSDKQPDLLRKYRRMDGLEGSAHLIQLIDSYNPRRRRDGRYHNALRIAEEIDDRSVRLRGSAKGKLLIEAVERLSARIKVEDSSDDWVERTLRFMHGVNFVDLAIQDTLWIKYQTKISDAELREFSDYLVDLDPSYPSWSERDFVKDYSRINEAGFPLQTHIMKHPERYYQAYRSFKKLAGQED